MQVLKQQQPAINHDGRRPVLPQSIIVSVVDLSSTISTYAVSLGLTYNCNFDMRDNYFER